MLWMEAASADTATSGATSSWVTVAVQRSAHVAHTPIMVGDIASLSPATSSCARDIAQIKLGPAPTPGATNRLRAVEVASTIAAVLPPVCSFQMEGEAFAAVSAVGVTMDRASLAQKAALHLRQSLEAQGLYRDIEITPVEVRADPPSVLAGTEYAFRPAASVPRRRMVIDVEVSEPGRAPWNYPIWFAVRAKAQAWVLEQAIAAGAALSAARKHWDWTELTEAGGVPAGQDFPFEDYMAKVPLDAGVTLTLQVVTRRPEVFAGQPVSLRYRSPRIEVAAPGIALQSGNTGDRVHVKNSGSGDETIGIVEGNGVVQVTPQ